MTAAESAVSAYRGEAVSLLQYLRQTEPYAPNADRPLRDRVHDMGRIEGESLNRLVRWMEDARIPVPNLGGFATEFTGLNYLHIRKLIQPVLDDQVRRMGILQRCAEQCGDATLGNLLTEMHALKAMHAEELRKVCG